MTFVWPGFEPEGYSSSASLLAAVGTELEALRGARICNAYTAWDIDAEQWCPSAPVVLELEQAQLEVGFKKSSFMTLTINAVNLNRSEAEGVRGLENEPELRYEWRTDRKELAAYDGAFIVGIDLIEQVVPNVALRGMSIHTDRGKLAVVNTGAESDIAVAFNPRNFSDDGCRRIIAI